MYALRSSISHLCCLDKLRNSSHEDLWHKMGPSINGNVLQCTTKWQATSFMDTAWPLAMMAKQKLQWFATSLLAFSKHGNVICFLKLLLVCIFRLSCFLLVRSLLARFQWLPPSPPHAAAADQPREAMEWVASRGGCSSSPSGDWEAVVEATREQSGEKLKLKGFVQLCSPKCWRACRSSNVPVKMCAPRRDKIMWLKLTTRGCCSERPHHRPRLLAAASYIPRGHRNARVFLRLVGPHTTK